MLQQRAVTALQLAPGCLDDRAPSAMTRLVEGDDGQGGVGLGGQGVEHGIAGERVVARPGLGHGDLRAGTVLRARLGHLGDELGLLGDVGRGWGWRLWGPGRRL